MHRMALALRYDGSAYHGWQHQEQLQTVQGTLEKALTFVANHPVSLICAGRTDAGVHASAQVVHFDTKAERSNYSWVFGANSNLPADISVIWAKPVEDDFHARYSALARRYRYLIYNNSIRPALLRHHIGWCYRELNVNYMQKASDFLLGEHDFSSFRGSGCQSKSAVRSIYQIEISRIRSMVVVEIQANAFLLHMVRNIVGLLMMIGAGDRPPEWAKEVLEAKDRRQAGATISPAGLYLVEVIYPKKFKLPCTPLGPFFLP